MDKLDKDNDFSTPSNTVAYKSPFVHLTAKEGYLATYIRREAIVAVWQDGEDSVVLYAVGAQRSSVRVVEPAHTIVEQL